MSDEKVHERKKLSLQGRETLSIGKNIDNSRASSRVNPGGLKRSFQIETRRKRNIRPGLEKDIFKPQNNTNNPNTSSQGSLTFEERTARINAVKKQNQSVLESEKNTKVISDSNDSQKQQSTSPEKELQVENIVSNSPENEKKLLNENIISSKNKKPLNKNSETDENQKDKRGARVKLTVKRDEQRRQNTKLTVNEALYNNERTRSLSSVKRQREKVKNQLEDKPILKQQREVVIPDNLTVSDLANRMAEKTADVVKELMKLDIMATATQVIDGETAELVVIGMDHKPKRISESDIEQGLSDDNDPEELKSLRPPVVTIMGHVDHGKTSLLDSIRKSKIVSSEAGGITQHIGAYQIKTKSNSLITFIDTPGHAAFTNMRSRGANITDIVIIVVAADDGVKDQTIEAINHAKASQCPIIVAINKCDKPEADPQRVKTELLNYEIIAEDLGGDVQVVEISAITGKGLPELEESIILQSEILELKSNSDRYAEGVVIESKVEKGRGSVANVLVTRGTLKVGDIFVVGSVTGRVRALIDDLGKKIKLAKPSTPVEILGINGTPFSGDLLTVVETDSRAREIAEYRLTKQKNSLDNARLASRGSLEQMMSAIKDSIKKELPVIIKTDVHGSLEAIKVAVSSIGDENAKVQLLFGGVGGVSESDVSLAIASNAIIFCFNVRAIPQARDLAKIENVEIRYHSIIYELLDEVKNALTGILDPETKEEFIGYAKVKEVFNISKIGKIAGCEVTEGIIKKGCKVRLLRDNVVIHEGALKTLKRFKDEVKEVKQGIECGIALENYNDINVADVFECIELTQIARTLK